MGVAKRHDDWDALTAISSIGRSSLETIANYRLIKAATRAEASPQARLLLVHLIGYLPVDKTDDPKTRFVVFPGNERLADELAYSKRSIQRLADQLEENGLLRRCYNGVNRRIGFDLTPLAMQHEDINAKIVEVQTRRKIDRERRQMELSLSANRIARPSFPAKLSSLDDNSSIHNRSTKQDYADLESLAIHKVPEIATVLSTIGSDVLAGLFSGSTGDMDRTDASDALKEAHILQRLTGSGRAAHLGWVQAKRALGFENAAALVAIADQDPRRRASTDRYFGWLLRMILAGNAHQIIEDAAARVQNVTRKAPAPKRPSSGVAAVRSEPDPIGKTRTVSGLLNTQPSPAASGQAVKTDQLAKEPFPDEERDMQEWRDTIRNVLGERSYESWMTKVHLRRDGNLITLRARHEFVARHIEKEHGAALMNAARQLRHATALQMKFES